MSTSKKSPAETSSNYHHGNLREALISSGLELLESTQNPEFSLRELTRRVGVSVNAAYRHFASKEALLAAMAVEGFKQLAAQQMAAMTDNVGAGEGFMAAGRAYVQFARSNPGLFRLMYGRFAATNPDVQLHNCAQFAFAGMLHAMASVLQLPAEDPRVKVSAIRAWSTVHGLSQLIIDGQVAVHTEDIDGLIDEVFQPELAGIYWQT